MYWGKYLFRVSFYYVNEKKKHIRLGPKSQEWIWYPIQSVEERSKPLHPAQVDPQKIYFLLQQQ